MNCHLQRQAAKPLACTHAQITSRILAHSRHARAGAVRPKTNTKTRPKSHAHARANHFAPYGRTRVPRILARPLAPPSDPTSTPKPNQIRTHARARAQITTPLLVHERRARGPSDAK